jgi:hypothetical protein
VLAVCTGLDAQDQTARSLRTVRWLRVAPGSMEGASAGEFARLDDRGIEERSDSVWAGAR